MKSLLELSLGLTVENIVTDISWTLLINIFMNSWKILLYNGTMGVGVRPGKGAYRVNSEPKAIDCLIAGFPRQIRGIVIVERVKTK